MITDPKAALPERIEEQVSHAVPDMEGTAARAGDEDGRILHGPRPAEPARTVTAR